MPRLFIAVDLPEEIKDALRTAQARLQGARLPVRHVQLLSAPLRGALPSGDAGRNRP